MSACLCIPRRNTCSDASVFHPNSFLSRSSSFFSFLRLSVNTLTIKGRACCQVELNPHWRQIYSSSGTACAVRSCVILNLNRRQTPAFTGRPLCQPRPFPGSGGMGLGWDAPAVPRRQVFSASCLCGFHSFFGILLSKHTHRHTSHCHSQREQCK